MFVGFRGKNWETKLGRGLISCDGCSQGQAHLTLRVRNLALLERPFLCSHCN